MTENRFIFQTRNQACHDTQEEQIASYNKGKSILLFNSNHCKLLLKKLIAAQARTSTREVRTALNSQQMRIVARSQQKISQLLLRKTFNYKNRSTHMQQMLSK